MIPPPTSSCSYCEVLTAWSTFAEALLIFFGGIAAFFQVKAATDARRLQAALSIFERLENPAFRTAREFVHEHMDEIDTMLNVPAEKGRDAVDQRIWELSRGKMDLAKLTRFVHTLENLAMLIVKDDNLYNLLIPEMLANMFLTDGTRLANFIAYRKRPENRSDRDDRTSLFAHHIGLLTDEIWHTKGAERSRNRQALQKLRSRFVGVGRFVTAIDELGDISERRSVVEDIVELKQAVHALQQAPRTGPREHY